MDRHSADAAADRFSQSGHSPLCHSTVDNSVARGIGKRLDGWPNRDLTVGAIIALSPSLSDAQKATLRTWGPGKFDPRPPSFHDGSAPDLPAVVNHYDALFSLGLTNGQKTDLVEFLKSL